MLAYMYNERRKCVLAFFSVVASKPNLSTLIGTKIMKNLIYKKLILIFYLKLIITTPLAPFTPNIEVFVSLITSTDSTSNTVR